MSRVDDVAEALLCVLLAHVIDADKWEDYYTDFALTGFDGARREELMVESTQPLAALIRREGFKREDISKMIPVSYVTTHEDRARILKDLTEHAYATYDVVPF